MSIQWAAIILWSSFLCCDTADEALTAVSQRPTRCALYQCRSTQREWYVKSLTLLPEAGNGPLHCSRIAAVCIILQAGRLSAPPGARRAQR